jgi:predicted ATPase
MQITNISIHNYKSLKNVLLNLHKLSLIVGANASGKSNLADCFDFISEVYRHGLEVAVGRKGGYENIAYRRTRRSKQPIQIKLSVTMTSDEWPSVWQRIYKRKARQTFDVKIDHAFSFVARGYAIRADFSVVNEYLTISKKHKEDWIPIINISRDKDNRVKTRFERQLSLFDSDNSEEEGNEILRVLGFPSRVHLKDLISNTRIASTELFVALWSRLGSVIYGFTQIIESIRVFQLSPTKSREFGVPTPRPELDRTGANLPAVVDVMIKKHPKEWDSVLQVMRKILPELQRIEVNYTTSRTLGLFFNEKGVGRPWSVDEVSDGTVQTLCLLIALFDPASKAVVIEEPENSVHPWIIRSLLDACKQAADKKQIVITSHSPIVINAVRPEDVLVMWRSKDGTQLKELVRLDQNFIAMWETGEIPTFEYLDSGALLQAVPPVASKDSLESGDRLL